MAKIKTTAKRQTQTTATMATTLSKIRSNIRVETTSFLVLFLLVLRALTMSLANGKGLEAALFHTIPND